VVESSFSGNKTYLLEEFYERGIEPFEGAGAAACAG
jgi:hypothetical protein